MHASNLKTVSTLLAVTIVRVKMDSFKTRLSALTWMSVLLSCIIVTITLTATTRKEVSAVFVKLAFSGMELGALM